jgi:hypothetical protein
MFGANGVDIDFDPFRRDIVFQQTSLVTVMILSGLLNTETASLIHFAEISNLTLPQAARGPI